MRGFLYGFCRFAIYPLLLLGLMVGLLRLATLSINSFPGVTSFGITWLTGMDLSAEQVQVRWQGQDPVLQLRNVSLGAGPKAALTLGEVDLHLDMLRSLVFGEFFLGHLKLEGLNASLVQEGEAWHIAGLTGNRRSKTGFLDDPGSLLKKIRLLELENLSLQIQAAGQTFLLEAARELPLRMSGAPGHHQLELDLLLSTLSGLPTLPADLQLPVFAQLDFSNNPDDPAGFWLQGHARLQEFDAAEVLTSLTGEEVESARLAADLWLRFYHGVGSGLLEFAIPEVKLHNQGEGDFAKDVSGQLAAVRSKEGLWRFSLKDMRADVQGNRLVLPDTAVAGFRQSGQQGFIARLPDMSLQSLYSWTHDWYSEPGREAGTWVQMLEALAPEGKLQDVYLSLREGQPHLVTRVRDFSIDSYAGSPGVEQFQAVASLAPDSGWVAFNNSEFQLGFAEIFDSPWLLDRGRGLITYERRDHALIVLSDLLEVQQGPMRVKGRFLLNLPPERMKQGWALQLGITDGEVARKMEFVPNFIGSAYDWVDDALIAGHLNEGGMVFHGALSNLARRERKTYDLYFDTTDGYLLYHPDYPPVTALRGVVNVTHRGVAAEVLRGKVYDTRVVSRLVSVPFSPDGAADHTRIRGEIFGPAQNVLSFLQKTPLHDTVRGVTDFWRATGIAKGSVDLLIPLDGETEDLCDCRVLLDLPGIELDMEDHRLTLGSLKGRVGYDPVLGLYSERLDADVFGQSMTGRIGSELEKEEIHLNVAGRMDASDLRAWTGQPVLRLAEGEFDFTGSIVIPTGDRGTSSLLRMHTDLHGVLVDLPAPLGKSAEERVSFSYFSSLDEGEQTATFRYAEKAEGRLLLYDGDLHSGLVSLYRPLTREPYKPGLTFEGFLPSYDVAAWDSWLAETAPGLVPDASADDAYAGIIRDIRVDIGKADLYGMTLPSVQLQMTREPHAWLAKVESPDVKGRIRIPDTEDVAWGFDLDYLRLGEDPLDVTSSFSLREEDEDQDPMLGVDPSDLMPMDFSVGNFVWDGEALGTWSFNLTSDREGALITNLEATVGGLQVVGPHAADQEQETSAHMRWWRSDEGHKSLFRGRLRSDDLAATLTSWELAPNLESNDVVLDSDLHWSGSPAMLSFLGMEGEVDINVGRGRFLNVDERTETLKLLGILDIPSLVRRLRFDFSDVTQEGYSFNQISGAVELRDGAVMTSRPLEVEGPSSNLKLSGSVDLETHEVDSSMIVTLPIDRNLPWFAALASGTVIGAKVFLAQKLLLHRPIDLLTSARYRVSGTLDDPVIKLDEMFNNETEN